MKNVVVVGGGVAGLSACLRLVTCKDINVTLIERYDDVGKRILVSGNGRCNFFNSNFLTGLNDPIFDDAKKIATIENSKEFLDFFLKTTKIKLFEEEDGRLYPYSNRAENIQLAIKEKLFEKKNFKLVKDTIKKIDSDKKLLYGETNRFTYDNLILALGGMSYNYPKFDYNLFKDLNVKYTNFTPCICPIKLKVNYFKKYSGLRFFARIVLTLNGKTIYQEDGEVLIKDDGISGVCIYNLTTYLNPQNLDKYELHIQVLQHHNVSLNSSDVQEIERNLPTKLVLLIKHYHKELLEDYQYGGRRRDKLDVYRDLTFKIDSLYDFKYSQVSKGGVALSELCLPIMKLKKHNQIFMVGEMLDITVPCGGYNIGLSMIEGYLAAGAIIY